MVNLSKFIYIQIPHFFIYRNIPHLGSIFFFFFLFFHYSYHRLINLLVMVFLITVLPLYIDIDETLFKTFCVIQINDKAIYEIKIYI